MKYSKHNLLHKGGLELKTLVRVKKGSFPVRYNNEKYNVGDEFEVLNEHANHSSFEILGEIEPPKKRGTKTTPTE